MLNATITKFGYPDTLLAEYEHWVVLVRPKQVTAGSMVLACKEVALALGEVSAAAWQELARVTRDLEAAAQAAFRFDRINYLALMMVDPHVHFHVLPRYAEPRKLGEVVLEDVAWPKPADIIAAIDLAPKQLEEIATQLRANWPS